MAFEGGDARELGGADEDGGIGEEGGYAGMVKVIVCRTEGIRWDEERAEKKEERQREKKRRDDTHAKAQSTRRPPL